MFMKEAGVLVIATLSALAAGGGVMQLGAHALAPPARQSRIDQNRIDQNRIEKSADGHYWADAAMDGGTVRFLVDTGSSAVALTASDAARLGIDLKRLTYDRPVATAAGRERAAAVILDHIEVAGVRVDHVSALVMRRGLSSSLLGMSYLGRLSRIEATPEALVLSR